jgi:membrane protein
MHGFCGIRLQPFVAERAMAATFGQGVMPRRLRGAWEIVRAAASDWVEDKAAQMGAALAFYSVLSLAPLVVIALAIVSLVLPDTKTATAQFLSQVESMVGAEGAKAIQGMLDNSQEQKSGVLASILGVITLLFGASGVFGQLQEAMNTVWDVPPKKGGGIWGMIRSRFLSFAMVLGTGFLLLISLLLSAFIAGLGQQIGQWWPALEPLSHLANEVATFLVMTLLFAMMFKLLPDTKVAWRDVWIGALITAALFAVGKLLIGLYLGKSAVGSAYGAAGSLVVLLVWIYYSAQILFFGAELTHAYAERRGSKQPAR